MDGPDEVASSRTVSALASIIFPTPHKIQNDDKTPTTHFSCEGVNVFSGTGPPR